MKKSFLLQLFLIVAAAALTAFLYFSPKTNLAPSAIKTTAVDFDVLLGKAKQQLPRQEVSALDKLEKLIQTKAGNEKAAALDSLAYRWDIIGEPAVAAVHQSLDPQRTRRECAGHIAQLAGRERARHKGVVWNVAVGISQHG